MLLRILSSHTNFKYLFNNQRISHLKKLNNLFRFSDNSKCFSTLCHSLNTFKPENQIKPNQVFTKYKNKNHNSQFYRYKSNKLLSTYILPFSDRYHISSPYAISYSLKRNFHASNPNFEKEDDKNKKKDEEQPTPLLARFLMFTWVCILGYVAILMWRLRFSSDMSENLMGGYISWNTFLYDMLSKGEVEQVTVHVDMNVAFIKLHPGAIVKGKPNVSQNYVMTLPEGFGIEERIRAAEKNLGIPPEKGIPISFKRSSQWQRVISAAVVIGAIILFFKYILKFSIKLPNPSEMFSSQLKAKFVRVDKMTQQGVGVNFKDVAGLKEAKQEIMEFVDYLKRPTKYKELGARIPRGALLLGPPGCGKTLLARAVATEARVPFLAMAGSEFVEMLGGLGASRVRDLFKEARQQAPCIIYIDEIDAIGRKRSGDNMSMSSSEEEHTLNQLLVEMDGMGTVEGIIMLASTNRSEVLDKALLRPGRFDRHILIDFPTLEERREIFNMYLEKLQLRNPPASYSERLAQLSPGMSGADIANICNEAALHAARNKNKVIDQDDFEYAVERVVAGIAKKSGILSPQEKKVVAYHEAGHALVGWLLEHTDSMLKVSIVPRTGNALGFAMYMPKDKMLYSRQELMERMCMALGGRVAESLTFNSITSGAQDDLRKVTNMAYETIRSWGMSERLGHVSYEVDDFGIKPYSKRIASLIDQEAKLMVSHAYKSTEKLLQSNKTKLKTIAEALIEKETLSYNQMEELIGPPIFNKQTKK